MEFFVISIIKAAVVAFALLTTLAYLQWVERKVIAHIQVRLGPSRVGPHGLLQPLADVIKLITKEDLIPPYVNKFVYLLAPFLAVTMSLISISVIPFGSEIQVFGHTTWMQLTDLNIGLLFILAVSSMGVYGIALAGWASNNKYALLGGLRSSAQMISYELPLSLAIAAPLLLVNTLSLREIVQKQAGSILNWNVLPQIVSFFVFVIAGFAETNRVPFDLPEAENELVAGFHTEYSSMKFAAFFMAEYANMITVACLASLLFLGGWHGPLFGPAWLQAVLPVFWFVLRVFGFLFVYIWVRGTLPRFRYDQLMAFGWKFLLPLAIANLVITGLIVALKS
jgi:NADH-quinone oxidoreductase subunit H